MNSRGFAFSATVLACGALFGFGLSLATMIQPEVVLSFLRFDDLGLLLVLCAATGTTLLVYQLAPRLLRRPLFAQAFRLRPDETMRRTLGGAALFGVGWGLSGVCPGPAIAGLGAGNWPLLWCVGGMLAGAYVQGRWFSGKRD
ncbi:YeeE/YedE family protein [Mangrovimicrobium sediminis]|uniref:YeeE/YedE family protein n=1 Tax=Mangrovimicrobium sediminis TaxID=2562682 RepID=A0A4Z0M6C4_9GAMM|nr:DUF6691 family protein [Haliea sp. SAOS-164]TGD74865.1 YeeE/YedE family protein [Haliea sp. SAOS-164]